MKNTILTILVPIYLLLAFYSKDVFAYENYVIPSEVIPADELLKCDELIWYERVICEDVATQISEILEQENIFVTENEVVHYIDPVTPPQDIDTGHSCSHRAWLQGNYARISLGTDASFDFSGDLISDPLMLGGVLPVSLYARANVKEEWGYNSYSISCSGFKCRKKRHCGSLGTDSYYADFDLDTDANFLVSVDMQPEFGLEDNGDYYIKIKPIAVVNLELDNFDVEFDLHGKNSLAAALGSFVAMFSSATNLVADWLTGSPSADTRDQLYADFGYGVLSAADVLGSVGSIIQGGNSDGIYEAWVNIALNLRAESGIENVDRSLENNLNNTISLALELDQNGERTWTIDKDRPLERLSSMLVAINSINL